MKKGVVLFGLLGLLILQSAMAQLAPFRIISLDLCTDWMLIEYARPGQVLAYSPLLYRFPADWVPENLPTHNGSLEQILELEPDLVLSGEYNAMTLRKRLQQLGNRIEVLAMPNRLDSIVHYQANFNELIGDKNPLEISDQQNPFKNRSLLLLGANGIGTGTQTLENDVIERAGWTNYLQQPGYINLDLEALVSSPPDAVLWSSPLSNSLSNLFAEHPVLKRLIQKSNRLKTEYWRWQCPGPWTYGLIQELAR